MPIRSRTAQAGPREATAWFAWSWWTRRCLWDRGDDRYGTPSDECGVVPVRPRERGGAVPCPSACGVAGYAVDAARAASIVAV